MFAKATEVSKFQILNSFWANDNHREKFSNKSVNQVLEFRLIAITKTLRVLIISTGSCRIFSADDCDREFSNKSEFLSEKVKVCRSVDCDFHVRGVPQVL